MVYDKRKFRFSFLRKRRQFYVSCKAVVLLFLIVYDDSTDKLDEKYELVIDFSGRVKGHNCVDGNNAFETQRHLKDLLNKVLPFSIKSDGCIDYLLFSDQGKKYM